MGRWRHREDRDLKKKERGWEQNCQVAKVLWETKRCKIWQGGRDMRKT